MAKMFGHKSGLLVKSDGTIPGTTVALPDGTPLPLIGGFRLKADPDNLLLVMELDAIKPDLVLDDVQAALLPYTVSVVKLLNLDELETLQLVMEGALKDAREAEANKEHFKAAS